MKRWGSWNYALAAVLGLAAVTVPPASAQDDPSRPIRIIVPTAPGGMSDSLSRTFAAKASAGHPAVGEVIRRAGIKLQ